MVVERWNNWLAFDPTPRWFGHYILGDERSYSLLYWSSSNDPKRVIVTRATRFNLL